MLRPLRSSSEMARDTATGRGEWIAGSLGTVSSCSSSALSGWKRVGSLRE